MRTTAFIILFFIFGIQHSFSQTENDSLPDYELIISENYYDSISPDSIVYLVSGHIYFPAQSSFHIELIDTNALSEVLYSYSCILQNDSFTNGQGFSYNSITGDFSFSPGAFDKSSLMLHVWIENTGESKSQIYHQK